MSQESTTTRAEVPDNPQTVAQSTAYETAALVADHGAPPLPRQAAVVYNPTKVDIDALRAAVEAAEAEAGYPPSTWIETTADDPGAAMAQEAIESGANVVLAVGGDGTVRAVAEGLRGTDVALALVPRGTGNLLARNLGLQLTDLGEAVSTAFAGTERAIDVGVATMKRTGGSVDHAVFLVLGGIGLDAQMLVNTDEGLKKKAGWLAYVQAIARSAKGGRRIKLRYQIDDGEPRVARVHTLMVGNVGVLTGDVVLMPDAEFDDGVLDVVALRPNGVLGWVSVLYRVLVEHRGMRGRADSTTLPLNKGGRKRIDSLRYLRGTNVDVRLADPEAFELDGDEMGDVVGFTMTVEPRSLSVRVP